MAFDGKQKSINLIGNNEIDINMNSPSKYRPKIILDECKVGQNLLLKTSFIYLYITSKCCALGKSPLSLLDNALGHFSYG